LRATLENLAWLVALDTQNPPRAMGSLADRVRASLPSSFAIEVEDLGDGCLVILATRGAPKLLFNAHLDTVPRAQGWQRDPWTLSIEGERAYGLGACDIKGAAAAMIAAASSTNGDAALLFTTDEEAGSGKCVKRYLARKATFDGVIVAEPTSMRAVTAHRGIATTSGVFHGTPGHASAAGALENSAVHEAVRWASRALDHATALERKGGALAGLRFNLGRIEGGEKPNMIAGSATVRFGVRPPPGRAPIDVLAELQALALDPTRVTWTTGFLGDPLPSPAHDQSLGEQLAKSLDLPLHDPVDFWTEGALFSAAGYPTIVLGPGDIARAHTADEWVELHELEAAERFYTRVFSFNQGGTR
jgi:acetylornithine deacetylase